MRRRKRDELAKLDPRVAFAVRHHRNTRGQPILFDGRPYLLPIYCDRARVRVFRKAVQCGISEMLIIDALEAASRGLQCLYVMPTQDRRDKFVANRVSRVIRGSKHYRRLVRSGAGRANSSGMKHFGDGVISFVGSNAASEFIEFPADLVLVDELDRCAQNNLPLVRDRLAASPHKLAAYASTPTVDGIGVAKLFDASDAKQWFVRCPSCGTRQPLDFFRNVLRQTGDDEYELLDRDWVPPMNADGRREVGDMYRKPLPRSGKGSGTCPRTEDIRVFCATCGRPINRLAPGEWVAKHPQHEASGYHISQLFVPTCSVRDLWEEWQKALHNDYERQRFHNSLLGEPFAAAGCGLTRAELLACCRDYAMPARAAACTMGVDVGEWFHVRISDHPEPGVRRAVFIGRTKTLEELDALIERYDVRCCVIDAQPEAHLVTTWQKAHRAGRIWRCTYTDRDEREFRKEPREGRLHAARTPSLDDATEQVRMQRNHLPRNAATLDGGEFVAQMTAPVRTLVDAPNGGKRHVWTKPGADHHRHADNYDALATRLWLGSGGRTVPKVVLGAPRRTVLPVRGPVFRAA